MALITRVQNERCPVGFVRDRALHHLLKGNNEMGMGEVEGGV